MSGLTISATGVTELRKRVAGTVCVPGDEGYQRLAAAWNLTARQEPAVVVAPTGASDVAQAVRIASAEGLRVAVQNTGHGAAGRLGGDTLLLNMRALDGIQVDGATHTAEVGAGASWGSLAQPAATDGLAGLAGTAGGVGIAGYTFLGGVGWLARPRGLASASLFGVDYVDAAGRIGHADEHTDPDALWAFRGGGGVGIAISLRFRLYAHARLYAGARFWPVEDTPTVLARWLAWTAQLPPSLTSLAWALQAPAAPGIPEPLRGRAVIGVGACGAAPDGDRARIADCFAGLPAPLLDTFRDRSPAELTDIHMDPPGPVPARGDGRLVARPDPATASALFQASAVADRGPLTFVELRHLGGAAAEGSIEGALTVLDGEFALVATGAAADAAQAATVEAQLRRIADAAAPV
ncbi:MAG TPA: FAD-binding protein, partial [Chloroflexota bacterium]|nr:FAD-binding protein [Chloroflexota bacterium]